MLTGGDSLLYRQILASNPRPIHRVEVWADGARIDTYGDEGLPILGGSISATLNSRVTRQANVQVSEDLFPDPDDPADLLAPYGNELRIWAGVDGAGGPDHVWQVFRGKIQNVALRGSIRASDRAEEVLSDPFLAPVNSDIGVSVLEQFMDLISNSLPDATFGTSDDLHELVPRLTWENDRASALDELAKGARAFWYALANGDFVLRRVPWSVVNDPVVTYTDNTDDTGGTITEADIQLSREDVYNVVAVVGERSDGTPPVYAVVSDNNPASPTYSMGKFGRKGLLQKVQTVYTPGQAAEVAEDILLRRRALTQAWTTTQIFDAALELGDAATLRAKGHQSVQVAAAFAIPLSGSAEMSVSWRAQTPGSEGT